VAGRGLSSDGKHRDHSPLQRHGLDAIHRTGLHDLRPGHGITIAILSDKSERPVLPRWLGWFNLWAQIIYLPGILIPYFKSGPLAWNGLLAFWIPVVVFTVWLCLITAMLLRAINEQEHAITEGSAAGAAAGATTAGTPK
jgi:hypothetical protein